MSQDRRRESERRSAQASDALAAHAPPRSGGGLGERIGLLGHEADAGARPARRLLASLRLRPSTDGRFHAVAAAAGEGLRQLGGHPGVGARGRELGRRQRVAVAVEAQRDAAPGPDGRERRRVGDRVADVHHAGALDALRGDDVLERGELHAAAHRAHGGYQLAAHAAVHLRPEEVVEPRYRHSVGRREVVGGARLVGDLDEAALHHARGFVAQPCLLVLRHQPRVQAQLRAAYVAQRESGELAERLEVRRVGGRDDEGRQKRGDPGQRLERPGHHKHALGAEGLDTLVGDLEGLEERRQQPQGVAGVVAGLVDHVGEEVVVLAQPGEELRPVWDEVFRDLLGVVVPGEWAFAIGHVNAARRLAGAGRAAGGRVRTPRAHRLAISASTGSGRSRGSRADSASTAPAAVLSLPCANWQSVWYSRGISRISPRRRISANSGSLSPSAAAISATLIVLRFSRNWAQRGAQSSPVKRKRKELTTGPRSSWAVARWIMAPVSLVSSSSSCQMTSCQVPVGPPGRAGCRLRRAYRRHMAGLTMSMYPAMTSTPSRQGASRSITPRWYSSRHVVLSTPSSCAAFQLAALDSVTRGKSRRSTSSRKRSLSGASPGSRSQNTAAMSSGMSSCWARATTSARRLQAAWSRPVDSQPILTLCPSATRFRVRRAPPPAAPATPRRRGTCCLLYT